MEPYQVIEHLRKTKGITKTHIAKELGHSDPWYGDISTGKIRVKADDLPKFAEILGVDVQYFFDHKVSETHNEEQEVH